MLLKPFITVTVYFSLLVLVFCVESSRIVKMILYPNISFGQLSVGLSVKPFLESFFLIACDKYVQTKYSEVINKNDGKYDLYLFCSYPPNLEWPVRFYKNIRYAGFEADLNNGHWYLVHLPQPWYNGMLVDNGDHYTNKQSGKVAFYAWFYSRNVLFMCQIWRCSAYIHKGMFYNLQYLFSEYLILLVDWLLSKK